MGSATLIIPAIRIATVTRTRSLGKKLWFTHKKYTLCPLFHLQRVVVVLFNKPHCTCVVPLEYKPCDGWTCSYKRLYFFWFQQKWWSFVAVSPADKLCTVHKGFLSLNFKYCLTFFPTVSLPSLYRKGKPGYLVYFLLIFHYFIKFIVVFSLHLLCIYSVTRRAWGQHKKCIRVTKIIIF